LPWQLKLQRCVNSVITNNLFYIPAALKLQTTKNLTL
jgi:hypothetical protein